jgi:hypothetical protein
MSTPIGLSSRGSALQSLKIQAEVLIDIISLKCSVRTEAELQILLHECYFFTWLNYRLHVDSLTSGQVEASN